MVATVFGTRPEITKLSPLIPLMDSAFDHQIVFTSQHYSSNMAELFFEELDVRWPDAFLEVRSSDVEALTEAVAEHLKQTKPDAIVVYGDTNSTLAAGRAAKALGLPLAHIEAGLRCFDLSLPEERTRMEVDRLSDILLCPTELQVEYLRREGIAGEAVVVGNLTVDAVRKFVPPPQARVPVQQRFGVAERQYGVVTVHRQDNVDTEEALRQTLECLRHEIPIIFPVHPRTQDRMAAYGCELPDNVTGTDAIGYLDFLSLLADASVVLSDSGGIQEEAILLDVPCLTLRRSTERWETVREGGNYLVGTNPVLVQGYVRMILDPATGMGERMRAAPNPYGERVAEKCLETLVRWVGQ